MMTLSTCVLPAGYRIVVFGRVARRFPNCSIAFQPCCKLACDSTRYFWIRNCECKEGVVCKIDVGERERVSNKACGRVCCSSRTQVGIGVKQQCIVTCTVGI